MGLEEQKEEREVLDSIFPDEITDISETSYRISIALDVPPIPTSDPDPSPPTLLLTISLPQTYPDTPPNLTLSLPPNTPRHPHLTLPGDTPHLLSALSPTITENTGMAMIFALVSTLKEAAEELIAERVAVVREAGEREAARAEEEENRKFMGERVTRGVFLEWKERFRSEGEGEAVEAGAGEKKRGKGEEKLTGRELWERGLVGRVEEEVGEEDVVVGVEGLRIGE